MPTDYQTFLAHKAQLDTNDGFDPAWMPDFLFGFQQELTTWALRQGRAAIFADCGMGKTPMSLVWAENVARHTGQPVLILTPLAVGPQFVREGDKFGIKVRRTSDGTVHAGINVTNYERLHYYRPSDFGGVVCDESSAIKHFSGKRQKAVTEFMRKVRFRLLGTATAAPNDYIELGTSSEALGYLGYMDMLARFFKNDQNSADTGRYFGSQAKWRFKGHAEEPFWRWVASWARALRRPSDLGYDDNGFTLPPLTEREHMVYDTRPPDGQLFTMPAIGLHEQRQERRRTIRERTERAAQLVDHDQPAVVWCHLNDEADLLEKLIPDAVQVAGADTDEAKEAKLLAFADGDIRVLVTKPQIGAFGLNWQHCAHMTFFPSHSYEQYYQGVRRCWRFGQTRPVTVDIVTTEGGLGVLKNLQRKSEQADRMFDRLVAHMNDALSIDRAREHTNTVEVPSWL